MMMTMTMMTTTMIMMIKIIAEWPMENTMLSSTLGKVANTAPILEGCNVDRLAVFSCF